MLGQLAGEMLEQETRAYEERIQNTPELRDLGPTKNPGHAAPEKTESGRQPDGGKRSTRPYALRHISHKHCHGGRHRYGDIRKRSG